MISINCKPYEGFYRKNVLYKINDACTVSFREEHETGKLERVNLVYDLEHHQYGLFAHEFRNPVVRKEGCKTADVLACVVDETQKKIHTIIFDVKSDISAFSDDLLRNESLLTAIKNVKKFICQIHDEILHKNGFMLYYSDEGFSEEETIGIVTFSSEKSLKHSTSLAYGLRLFFNLRSVNSEIKIFLSDNSCSNKSAAAANFSF